MIRVKERISLHLEISEDTDAPCKAVVRVEYQVGLQSCIETEVVVAMKVLKRF